MGALVMARVGVAVGVDTRVGTLRLLLEGLVEEGTAAVAVEEVEPKGLKDPLVRLTRTLLEERDRGVVIPC